VAASAAAIVARCRAMIVYPVVHDDRSHEHATPRARVGERPKHRTK